MSDALNNDTMLEMNKQVDVDGKPVREVAAEFPRTHKLP
ncbi:protein of unknown function [Paraburkholderia dioscoreae]|uniref:Uncharacterized protein n=1 Tax=Paraburkholderia dioscoreae TaxID=2604047 RepID=A0A5Q4Z9Y4_9BURK|nr:hypothetical protein [Paraburkholderia sp. USG1]VVD31349.1 protein of unknown function [Paraburkholderia dioscoreae]